MLRRSTGLVDCGKAALESRTDMTGHPLNTNATASKILNARPLDRSTMLPIAPVYSSNKASARMGCWRSRRLLAGSDNRSVVPSAFAGSEQGRPVESARAHELGDLTLDQWQRRVVTVEPLIETDKSTMRD